MTLLMQAVAHSSGPPPRSRRRWLERWATAALARQNARMPECELRERWTEADVLALPASEHDYFDRKSGRIFDYHRDRFACP